MYARFHFDPQGHPLSDEAWEERKSDWLPSAADKQFLKSIMVAPVFEPGVFANYIAPPRRGINRLPVNYAYVRTEE
jgi:benzoyl-CoA 2,3-dioxygenase component B